MNRTALVTTMAAAAILAAAVLGASPKQETTTDQPFGPGYGRGESMGRGGMRGGGWNDDTGRGPGMMQGQGRDATGRGMRQSPSTPALEQPLTLDGAAERVTAALGEWGYDGLAVDEVIQFQLAFYVLVKDTETGKGAAELRVDTRTGIVDLERGPAMMWNTTYGRTGRFSAAVGTAITADEAKTLAADWLEQSGDATAWTMRVNELPGYYSVQLVRDGKVGGIISVNATTKDVWYNARYGAFVASKEM